MSGDYLWKRGQSEPAATGSGVSDVFSTRNVRAAALDITVAAITGGTTPSITFAVDRLGGDDIWYQVYATAALTAVGAVSASLGLGHATAANDIVFTESARVRWTFGGAVVADSINFSGSFYGKD